MYVKAVWQQGYQVGLKVRDHTLIVDEPEESGGQDQGPMPTELLLASFASCVTLAIRHVSMKMRLELTELEVDVQGEFDRKNLKCTRMIASVTSNLDSKILDKVMTKAARYCYVSNTLQSDCEILYSIKEGEHDLGK